MKRIPFLLLVVFFLSGCGGLYFKESPTNIPPLRLESISRLGFREQWLGVVFNGEKIGFSHLKIEDTVSPGLFRVDSDGVVYLNFMGFKKEIIMKSAEWVNSDLTLVQFESERVMDGEKILVRGWVEGGRLQVKVTGEGYEEEKKYTLPGPLYAMGLINLIPHFQGLEVGRTYSNWVYDVLSQSVQELMQEVTGLEEGELLDEPAFRIETTLAGLSTTSWVNARGETLLEKALHGILITARESETAAKEFIYQGSLGKKDLLLDFSLIKTEVKIPCPRQIRKLDIIFAGLDNGTFLNEDERQKIKIVSLDTGKNYRFLVEVPDLSGYKSEPVPIRDDRYKRYLLPTGSIQSNHPDIVKLSSDIIAGETDALKLVGRLTSWVDKEIKDNPADSFTALNVLHSREGECQAHSYLYAALARAAGIPTKIVSGLVYVEDTGFLYHSWAESYVGYWLSVDPTLGQVNVDATHIKLIEGEDIQSLSPLVNIVGRVQAVINAYDYHIFICH
ncbi:MAG: transglutaminase-like domain-containing protein [Thermodesulfobacteriota bacterium]